MSRLLAAVATLLALSLVAPVAPASAVADDPYAPKVSTEIEITIVAKPGPGKPIKVQLKVKANSDSDEPVEGTLKIAIRDAGEEVFASGGDLQTTSYDSAQVTTEISGRPAGDYVLSAEFTPADPDEYLGSTAERQFTVPVAEVAGTADTDGILPNTGAPGMWWLLLAALLLAGGAGAVVASRRRAATG